MVNPFVATLRFAAFVLLTLGFLPAYLTLGALRTPRQARWALVYWQVVTRAIGFRIRLHGTPATQGPVLFTANHASYLDIVVLGSLIPGFFVAKTEVSGWPGFGFLARAARTVFVDRKRGGSARERDLLRERIDAGELLILFPEGTSNDGNRVLPFKSSLFAVAQTPISGGRFLPVQPISIAYSRLDGLPLQRAFRPYYAWYGDMTLFGHLMAALGLGNVTIDVICHPVVTIAEFANRKGLAHHCHDVVQRGVIMALAGRLPPSGIPAAPTPAASSSPATPQPAGG